MDNRPRTGGACLAQAPYPRRWTLRHGRPCRWILALWSLRVLRRIRL